MAELVDATDLNKSLSTFEQIQRLNAFKIKEGQIKKSQHLCLASVLVEHFFYFFNLESNYFEIYVVFRVYVSSLLPKLLQKKHSQ